MVVLKPQYKNGLPTISSLLANYFIAEQMIAEGELAAQEEEDIVADDGFDLVVFAVVRRFFLFSGHKITTFL